MSRQGKLFDRAAQTFHFPGIGSWLPVFLCLLIGIARAQDKPAAASSEKTFRAGASTSNITLPIGARNGGVISRGGIVKTVHDELHARCLVLDDGTTQIGIAVCDLRMINRETMERAKAIVAESTGIPADHLLISATHTHGAPGVIGLHSDKVDQWYREFLVTRIADGLRRAHANLAPAKVGWGAGSNPDQIFNRRWFMTEGKVGPNPFGEENDTVRMNPPRASKDLIKPAGPIDPELSILSVQHAEGRPLALLANYGVHYIGGYVGNHLSADYFGMFSERLQQDLRTETNAPPFVAMMSNGTSGDTNNNNFRQPRIKREPWQQMKTVADELAVEALRVYREIEHRSDLTLNVATVDLNLSVRKPDSERIAWAEKTLIPPADGDVKKINPRAVIYAQEALELKEFPEQVPVKLQAIRIGKLGIVAIPCEVFAETGLAIKKQSAQLLPGIERSFVIELGNGYNGYLPTKQQHEWGGYETWPARSSYLEVTAESKIRESVMELLREVAAD